MLDIDHVTFVSGKTAWCYLQKGIFTIQDKVRYWTAQ